MDNAHNIKRCPNCGVSQIQYDEKKGKLVCNYCHSEFDQETIEQEEISDLKGVNISDGSKTIIEDSSLIVLKCANCGAEVVINTNDNSTLKCHWCHSILSIDSKIGNGSIPDLILPFKIPKEEAKTKINDFINTRKLFAKRRFKKEFTTDNVIGVYFPYFVVDCNAHANFKGEGGRVVRVYKEGDNTYYDIEMSNIERDFDITIDDFEIEASFDKINKYEGKDAKNVINAIMPFDTENSVKYESNYLIGYNIEKRDLNVIDVQEKMEKSIKDIARYSIRDYIKEYESGVRWKEEIIKFNGKSISSVFLPVWIYSYYDNDGSIHYIALNARTGETMGSVPMNKLFYYLFFFILFFFVLLFPAFLFKVFDYKTYVESKVFIYIASFILSFFINVNVFFYVGRRYRNITERHAYETETKNSIINLKSNDSPYAVEKYLTDYIEGINTDRIEGDYIVKDEDI